ncbi:unknown [Bacteroides sp. CAG:770]|nr:unknown [Bacteroides sp. CAG:770]
MLDYQCVTEKAVASSRRRNSSRKADTRNFVCGRGSSHLRQSLAEPNDFISPFISPTLSICFTHISWQAIKSPDSLQPSIIMTCT